jgi:hypothetical protein
MAEPGWNRRAAAGRAADDGVSVRRDDIVKGVKRLKMIHDCVNSPMTHGGASCARFLPVDPAADLLCPAGDGNPAPGLRLQAGGASCGPCADAALTGCQPNAPGRLTSTISTASATAHDSLPDGNRKLIAWSRAPESARRAERHPAGRSSSCWPSPRTTPRRLPATYRDGSATGQRRRRITRLQRSALVHQFVGGWPDGCMPDPVAVGHAEGP